MGLDSQGPVTSVVRGDGVLDAFLKTLDGERPDQIVWTADITYWIAGQQQAGTAKPAWETEEGYLQLHRELGILPYYYYEKFWAAEPRYDRFRRGDRHEGRRPDARAVSARPWANCGKRASIRR